MEREADNYFHLVYPKGIWGTIKSIFFHKLENIEQRVKNKWTYKMFLNSSDEKIDFYLNPEKDATCKLFYPRYYEDPNLVIRVELASKTEGGLTKIANEFGLC